MITVIAKATIPLPAKQINLPHWFYSFTSAEFQKASKSNIGMSIEKNSNGKRVFNNKVAVSAHKLENHYIEEESSLNHLKMTSHKSQLSLFKQIPILIEVSYELTITPTSKDSALLTLTSQGKYPKWLETVSKLTLAKRFLQHHQDEEAAFYAKDILQKQQQKNTISL